MGCSHYRKIGHDARRYFQLIGYAEWWGERPRNEGGTSGESQQRNGTSTRCVKGRMAHADATQVVGGNVNKSDIETRKFDLAGLSKE